MNASTLRILASTISVVAISLLIAGRASGAKLDPAALALLNSVSTKPCGPRTIQLESTHKLDPAFGPGVKAVSGPIDLSVKRPNHYYAIQPSGNETSEIAYDGSELCVVYPAAKHYALEPFVNGVPTVPPIPY